jgi:hypothetical protein
MIKLNKNPILKDIIIKNHWIKKRLKNFYYMIKNTKINL